MMKIEKWLAAGLAVASAFTAAGCGTEPASSPTPDPCADVQEAVHELADEYEAVDPVTSERIANENWWADRMGFARKDDPAMVIVERYAYLVLESGDCFDPQTRADAQRVGDSLSR